MLERTKEKVKKKMKKMIPAKAKEKGAANKSIRAERKKMRTILASQQLLVEKNALTNFALQRKFTKRSDRKYRLQDIDFYARTAMKTT